MLEILFQGFLEWVYTLVLAIWEYFSGAIIDIMSMDFAYLESHIPVLPVIQQSMLAVGWALLIGNLIFQSARSMLTGLGFEAEDPKLLFTRTFVFSFLLLASPQICEIGLNLTARVIALVELPSAVLITTLSESVFAGFATAWLLVIVCGLVVMYQSIKLFIEMAERYFILSMLTITSPLAFGMGGSKSTSGIFTGWCKMYGSMCLLMVLNVVFVKILMSVLSYSPVGVDVLPWMVLVMAVVRTAKKSDSIITRIGLNPAITNEPRFPGMLSFIVARTMMSVVGNTIKQNGAAGSHAGTRSGSGGSNGYQSGTGGAGRNGNGGAGRNGPQQNHGGASSGAGGSSPNSSGPHVDAAETTRNTSGSGQGSGGSRKSGARRGGGNQESSTRHHYENNGGVQNQAAHQDSSNTARQDVSNQTSNAQYTTQNTGTASGGQFHQTGIPTGQDGQGTRRTSVPPGTHRAPAYTRPASVGTPGTAPAGTAGETAGYAASGTASVSETRETRYTSRPQNAAVSRTSVGVPATLSASRNETAHNETSESSSNSSRFSSAVQSTSANPTAPASVSPVDVTVDKGSQASVKDSRFTHRTESHPADMAKGGGTVVTASPAGNTVPHSTTGPSPIVTPSEKPAASESGETRFTNRPAPVDRNPSGTGTHIPAAPSRTEAVHSSVTAGEERHSGPARFTSVASQSGTVFQETVADSGKPMERNSITSALRPAVTPVGTAAVSPAGAVGKDTSTGSMETRFSQRDSSKAVEHSRNTVTTSTPRPETPRDSTTGSGTAPETRQSARSAATGNSTERVSLIPPAGPRQSVPDRPGHGETTEQHSVTPQLPASGKGASASKQSGAAGNVSFADTRQTMRETARQTGGIGLVVTRQERTAAPSVLHDSSPQATVPAAKGSADMARSEKPAHPERPGRPNAIPDAAAVSEHTPTQMTFDPDMGAIASARPDRPAKSPVLSAHPNHTERQSESKPRHEGRPNVSAQYTVPVSRERTADQGLVRGGSERVYTGQTDTRRPSESRQSGNGGFRPGADSETGGRRSIPAQRERGQEQRTFAPSRSSGPARPNRSGMESRAAYGQPPENRRQGGGRTPASTQGVPQNRRPDGNRNPSERRNSVPPHPGTAGYARNNPRQTAEQRQVQNPNVRPAPYQDGGQRPTAARQDNSGYRPRDQRGERPAPRPNAAESMRGVDSERNRRMNRQPPEQEKRPLFGLFGFGGRQSTRQSGRTTPDNRNDRR